MKNTFVVDELAINNLYEEIEKAPLDPKVNIKIAALAGDETMTLYSTVLKPGSRVNSHVHSQGIELYYILEGEGEIYTGKLKDDKVSWNISKKVKAGDSFAIEAGMVHQLKNTSEKTDLGLIFICPHSHLKDDRIITQDYN